MRLTRDGARFVASLSMGFACAYMGLVGAVNRLNYTVPTTLDMLTIIVNSRMWATGFLVIALLVGLSLGTGRYRRHAMQLVVAIMGPWAIFNMLWGLSTIRPVSLAAPGLAVVVAVVAQALASAWATENRSQRPGR